MNTYVHINIDIVHNLQLGERFPVTVEDGGLGNSHMGMYEDEMGASSNRGVAPIRPTCPQKTTRNLGQNRKTIC